MFDVIFENPDELGSLQGVEVRFLPPAPKRSTRKPQAMTIDEVMDRFEQRISDAREQHQQARREWQERRRVRDMAKAKKPPAVDDEESAGEEEEEEQEDCLCLICFDATATIVHKKCGHLSYCEGCRRLVVGEFLKMLPRTQLKQVQLESTKVTCPLCRQRSVLMSREKCKRKVFVG
eukprot:TRINITY_DN20093_c0_g1_i1.p1 TRINITY_DN20093_c0_g1~~TRINITY_DN20093_c0_g1_i1.p1  ORF type:complete len:177 (-),score=44.41 TRINITY_DN20093_c0_g1_i1:193-723(-)